MVELPPVGNEESQEGFVKDEAMSNHALTLGSQLNWKLVFDKPQKPQVRFEK